MNNHSLSNLFDTLEFFFVIAKNEDKTIFSYYICGKNCLSIGPKLYTSAEAYVYVMKICDLVEINRNKDKVLLMNINSLGIFWISYEHKQWSGWILDGCKRGRHSLKSRESWILYLILHGIDYPWSAWLLFLRSFHGNDIHKTF